MTNYIFFTQSRTHTHSHWVVISKTLSCLCSRIRSGQICPLDTVKVFNVEFVSLSGSSISVSLFILYFKSSVGSIDLCPLVISFFCFVCRISCPFLVCLFFVNNFEKKKYLFTLFIALSMQNGSSHWCAEYPTCSQHRCLWRWTYAMVHSY